MQVLSDSVFKHNGHMWCDCLTLERHMWPMDQCLYWTEKVKWLTACQLNGGDSIYASQSVSTGQSQMDQSKEMLYGKPVMTCMIIENGQSSCLWSPTAQGLGTGWDINRSLTDKVPLPHFLLDLGERHFQVCNYHYGAKATPAALQHGEPLGELHS